MTSTHSAAGSRRLDIQGLRAVAVAAVVVFHAGLPLPGGFVGVDVFFVISGFVITAMLLRELESRGRLDLRRFYARRIRRLMPALALVLVATAGGSIVLQSPLGFQQDTATVGLGAVLWMANVAIYHRVGGYFDRSADQLPLLHTWSLSVEEQFYLVFPLLVLIGWRLSRRYRHALAGAVLLVCAASLAFGAAASVGALHWVDRPTEFAFYMSPARAWEFGAGAVLAILEQRGHRLGTRIAPWAAWVGLAGVLASLAIIDESTPFPGFIALVPVLSSALLLAGGHVRSTPSRLLASAPMRWLGDQSYGWYLWHWPCIVFARLLWPGSLVAACLAAALSLLPAWLSYRFVEAPIRHGTFGLPWRSRPPRTGPARRRLAPVVAVAMGVPLLMYAGYRQAAYAHWGSARLTEAAAQTESYPIGYDKGCHEGAPLPDRDVAACTWHADAGSTVYLVGDSNAGMYADGLVEATARTNQRLVVGVRSNCPFVDAVLHSAGNSADCRDYVQGTTEWLQHQAPSTVVMAAAADQITDPHATMTDPVSGVQATTPQQKAALWTQALTSSIQALRSAGHTVVVLEVIPHFRGADGSYWSTAECSMLAMASSNTPCAAELPLPEADFGQQLAIAAERTATQQAGAVLADLRGDICAEGTCATVRDGRFVYREGKHISRGLSTQLAPRLAEVLDTARP
ncbi:acyltransferase family protein [Cumulibacter manganitolerans]|uniref:acyltransferase family protein n=1 Tax=Cumulibacter manganitolerans TaxID=1884992 RepID=UPI0012966E88|nr:acyltransferase family protein [Cumulibacter manganitolerans]